MVAMESPINGHDQERCHSVSNGAGVVSAHMDTRSLLSCRKRLFDLQHHELGGSEDAIIVRAKLLCNVASPQPRARYLSSAISAYSSAAAFPRSQGICGA